MSLSRITSAVAGWHWSTKLGAAWLAAVLVAIAGWYGWHWWRGSGKVYDFEPGTRLVYTVEYENVGASDFTALFRDKEQAKSSFSGLKQSVKTTCTGKLVLTVLSIKDDQVSLAGQFEQAVAKLSNEGSTLEKESKQITRDLKVPFFVEMDRRGLIHGVRIDPGIANISNGLIRAILGSSQFVLPGRRGSLVGWETDEEDPNGASTVRYERSDYEADHAGCQVYLKSRLSYEDRHEGDETSEVQLRVQTDPEGTSIAEINHRRGRLVSLEADETIGVQFEGKLVTVSRTLLSLELIDESKALGEVADLDTKRSELARTTADVSLINPNDPGAAEAILQRSALGRDDLDKLMGQLSEAEPGDIEPLQRKFQALVYLHRGEIAKLEKLLQQAAPKSLAMEVLLPALANSNTPEAQSAIIALGEKRQGEVEVMRKVIDSLEQQRDPTKEAEKFLRELTTKGSTEELRYLARDALGKMARTLRKKDPARSQALVRWAIKEFNKARNGPDRRQRIGVMGSTGDVSCLPIIRKHFKASDGEMRRAATGALMFYRGDDIDAALLEALLEDEEQVVRQEALRVFVERLNAREVLSGKIIKAHLAVFEKDKSTNVRIDALRTLLRVRKEHPEIDKAIIKVAKDDPDKDVRAAANEALKNKDE